MRSILTLVVLFSILICTSGHSQSKRKLYRGTKVEKISEHAEEAILDHEGNTTYIKFKKKIKSKIKIPVFLVGGMIDPKIMEDVIKKGDADYISLSRALINNPKFSNKIKEGSRELSKCIHCNLCLFCGMSEPLRCYYGKRK